MKTKKIFFSLFCYIILCAADCRKRSTHAIVTVTNKSNAIVIMAYKIIQGGSSQLCLLEKTKVLLPDSSYEEVSRQGWEEELKYSNFEFYIVDPNNFNLGDFYDCDSMEYKNTILKKYVITKDDIEQLKADNFIITYP